MKTSRIIKLLAGITVAATLCACGGGGGGGGGGSSSGGSTDKNWSYHPGSDDPKSQSDGMLLKGRHLELRNGSTSIVFDFSAADGSCSGVSTTRDGARAFTIAPASIIYRPTSSDKADAVFELSYTQEAWDGEGITPDTLNVHFDFHNAGYATCTIENADLGAEQSAEAFFLIRS